MPLVDINVIQGVFPRYKEEMIEKRHQCHGRHRRRSPARGDLGARTGGAAATGDRRTKALTAADVKAMAAADRVRAGPSSWRCRPYVRFGPRSCCAFRRTQREQSSWTDAAFFATASLAGLAQAALALAGAHAGPALLTVGGAIARGNRGAVDPALDQLMVRHGVHFSSAFAFDSPALLSPPA